MDNEKIYCVYKHTNTINGKVYIGKTCANPPEKRWRNDGSGYIQSPLFWNAIQKYGWDNFDHEIIVSNLTKEEANQMEKDCISKFQSNNREFGYNLTEGGEGTRLCGELHPRYGMHLNEDTRNKISIAHKKLEKWKGENNPNYGKHDFAQEGNPFYGKKHTEETKRKISEMRKGQPSPNKGKPMSSEQKAKLSKAKSKYKKPVIQFDKNYNIIAEYESLKEASNITGYNRGNISACCLGKLKTYHGFIWRYKNDEKNNEN